MAHDVGKTGVNDAARRTATDGFDREVRATIDAAIAGDPLTPAERTERMREALERCSELRERLLEQMGEPLPAGWSARMIREGRP